MGETEKLIIELASRFMVAHVEKHGLSRDQAYPKWALAYAKTIVDQSKDAKGSGDE